MNGMVVAVSECKNHCWDGITCNICKADIFDLYYDFRAKLETEEKIRDQARNCYENMQATNEKLRNDLKVERDVLSEQFNIEENLRKERDSLSAKIGELEKYAELGNLAEFCIINNGCEGDMSNADHCLFCFMRPYCNNKSELLTKRAELMAGDHHALPIRKSQANLQEKL